MFTEILILEPMERSSCLIVSVMAVTANLLAAYMPVMGFAIVGT